MKVYLEKTVGWACFILFVFVSVVYSFGYGKSNDQPFMQNALRQMEKALDVKIGKAVHLNKAKRSLELGTADKGGHRLAALNKVNQALAALKSNDFIGADNFTREAIEHVKAGIAFSDQNTPPTPTVTPKTGQPYMELGLKNLELALAANVVSEKVIHLEKAKNDLNSATSDKGGHRVAAIQKINQSLMKLNHNHPLEANFLIREAIEQVKKGIEAGAEK